jgi:hypothetical protein
MSRTLVPVMGQERCIGHLLHTCKGWRALDGEERELGYFGTDASASAAVLLQVRGALNISFLPQCAIFARTWP